MWRYFLYLIMSLLVFEKASAAKVTIAVASNFVTPAKEIALNFEEQTGHDVILVPGSSGRIFAQITHGAPFDVFLSADRSKPAALDALGLTITNSRFTYAIGSLVLWSRHRDFVMGNADILKQGRFNKLALANPKLSPYGIAAKETLQALGLYQPLSPKFIQGENIAQTFQFIATGNADLGFIAHSQIPEGKGGSFWIIPENLHSSIRQDAVILKSARNNQAALAFVRYLRSDRVKDLMAQLGYKIPEEER